MITTDVESRLAALEQEVAALHKLIEHNRIAARIRRGLDHADRGQTLSAREAVESLREKYNIAPE